MKPQMPKLSIIVAVYHMSRQAMNTLYSLSACHQRNVSEVDYEILVMENLSADNLDPVAVQALGSNIRHFRREEISPSPVNAINEGFREARAPFIGLIIDGARMVTPRVVEYALAASRMSPNALVTVPAFNLGPYLHHKNVDHDYGESQEQQILEQSRWKNNGYRLFDISNLGEANPRGVFQPFMENNCYFTSRDNFAAIGYANTCFQYPGGGALNLHMFRSIGMLPQCELYCVMAGEGSFHQFHGGVTTAQVERREELLKNFQEQLENLWGGHFTALEREPFLIGAVTSHAQGLLHYSSIRGQKRYNRLHEQMTIFCQDDRERKKYCYQADSREFTRCDPR